WTLWALSAPCPIGPTARRMLFGWSPLAPAARPGREGAVSFNHGRFSPPMKTAQFSTFGRPEAVVDCVGAADPPAPQAGEVDLTLLAFPLNPAAPPRLHPPPPPP